MQRICVYCGANPGAHPAYADMARALAAELVKRNLALVYGGGNVGLMGIIADSVLAAGGQVVGVIPRKLVEKEVAHLDLTEQHIVETMHQRKAWMANISDGFIALPGGFGTLDELFEILTWAQLGFHDKPCGLLDVRHYYAPLLKFLHHAQDEGFIKAPHRQMLLHSESPSDLLDRFQHYHAPQVSKWGTLKDA